jgi:hypothetical protein
MKFSLAGKSLLLLSLSIFVLIVFTLFDSQLSGLSIVMQRLIAIIGLVLPAATGAVFGWTSLLHKEGRAWLAITGITLNTLFVFFHVMLVLFAG